MDRFVDCHRVLYVCALERILSAVLPAVCGLVRSAQDQNLWGWCPEYRRCLVGLLVVGSTICSLHVLYRRVCGCVCVALTPMLDSWLETADLVVDHLWSVTQFYWNSYRESLRACVFLFFRGVEGGALPKRVARDRWCRGGGDFACWTSSSSYDAEGGRFVNFEVWESTSCLLPHKRRSVVEPLRISTMRLVCDHGRDDGGVSTITLLVYWGALSRVALCSV